MATCNYCMKTIKDDARFCPFCGRDRQAAPQPHHLLPGTVLHQKYRIGAVLGEGGFGITYVGEDTTLGIRVAIKEYYPNGYVSRVASVSASVTELSDAEKIAFYRKGRDRFLQEARVLARFSGARGIVDVRDFFEENNTAYIVMEFLDGVTLKEYLRQKKKLPPEETLRLLTPVMESLKQLHTENVIHRDISPDNIMLVGEEVKLLDFGAARSVGGDQKSLSVMLKPGYAPEEQYRSKGHQGPWTDIYALCATMYRCVTGVRPDESTDRLYHDTLQPPSRLGVAIAPNVEAAILKGLSIRAEDRFQSVDQLLDALQGQEQPAALPYPPVVLPDPPSTPASGNSRKLIPLLAVIAVVMVAAVTTLAIVIANKNSGKTGGTASDPQAETTAPAQKTINKDDYYLTVEGVDLQFPLTVADLKELGWTKVQVNDDSFSGFIEMEFVTPGGTSVGVHTYTVDHAAEDDYDVWQLHFGDAYLKKGTDEVIYRSLERITFHAPSVILYFFNLTPAVIEDKMGAPDEQTITKYSRSDIYYSAGGTMAEFCSGTYMTEFRYYYKQYYDAYYKQLLM